MVCPLHVNQMFSHAGPSIPQIKLRAKQINMNYILYLNISYCPKKQQQSEAVEYHPQSLHSNSATHHKTSFKKILSKIKTLFQI